MSSCFSRTELQHVMLVRQLSSYVERRARLYFTITVVGHRTVADLNPVDYKILATMQQRVYQRFEMLTNCDSVC